MKRYGGPRTEQGHEGTNRRENHANDDTVDNITNDGKNVTVNEGEDTSKDTTNGVNDKTRGRDRNAISANKDDDTATVGEDGRRKSPGNN
ncbi:hypothetical protein A4G99_05740 [Haladaptatus sp. R4]|nr:hypothetical protein A4G99_05740 [Haladaptatus sp. R4]